jgi:hypothetical protein
MTIPSIAFHRAIRLTAGAAACCTMLCLLFSAAAFAEEVAAPGWEVIGRTIPTSLPPGGEGAIRLSVLNLGAGEPAPGTILTDTLPEGLTAKSATMISEWGNPRAVVGCATVQATRVTCEVPTEFPGGGSRWREREPPLEIYIRVSVAAGASSRASDDVTVTGGGALTVAHASVPVIYGASAPAAGFANLDAWLTNADGTVDTQVGSHPYEMTIAFAFNSVFIGKVPARIEAGTEQPTGGDIRNLNINLPPGIVGDTLAVPRCARAVFDESGESGSGEHCPPGSQVGEDYVSATGGGEFNFGVYNLVPPPGVAAQFAFKYGSVTVLINSSVRTGGDNGITTHVSNFPQQTVTWSDTTIWGVPDSEAHRFLRVGAGCPENSYEVGCPAGAPEKPLLTLPTSCGAPPEFSVEMLGTWEDENYVAPLAKVLMHNNEGTPIGFTGCEKLGPFSPQIAIAPETSYADTPAGLTVALKMPPPQEGSSPYEELASPGLKDTTVVLPEGVVINPGQATGLVACEPSQEALGTLPDGEVNEGPPSCPEASKVGTDEMSTPLLSSALKGNVYILQKNPPEMELLVSASGDGLNLKLVGQVHLDAQTGQLTTTFANTPDLPFTEFKLSFSGGARAALATPTRCGSYQSSVDFTPWSSPLTADALGTSGFAISGGPEGSACAWPMAFGPSLAAGSTSDSAGAYTGFSMLLTRADGQQRIGSLQFKTPPGLLGMISRVGLCGEPQAASGACPESSQIGHTVATSGPGPYPFEVPQAGGPPAPIYLTGPYQGAPYGLSIVVPVVAGPFNLGTVVVRAKIEVDPHTSQLTVTTGELPRILDGIPTDLREIDAVVDRPGFMFNPTDCAPLSFSGSATSLEGASAPLSSRFQVGSCQALGFKPAFTVSTSGKTSRADGASLTAKIVYPSGGPGAGQATSQANIRSVKVDLPKQLPSRLTTLQKACPVGTFDVNPAGCPAASIVGHAKAVTPLLAASLEGPAYFVSHGGAKFPELIVVLQGDNVTVDVASETFISKAGITSSTFREVPDVPISTFELTLPQGRYSALAANGSLCKSRLAMPTAFVGQDGAVIHESTKIGVSGCPHARLKKKATKHKPRHRAKRARQHRVKA